MIGPKVAIPPKSIINNKLNNLKTKKMKQLTLTELMEVRGGYHPDYSKYDCKDLERLYIEWIDTKEEMEEYHKQCIEKGCDNMIDC